MPQSADIARGMGQHIRRVSNCAIYCQKAILSNMLHSDESKQASLAVLLILLAPPAPLRCAACG